MKTYKGVEFVTVGDLTRELKEFKKEHSEDEVVCDMPDEDTCYVSGIEVDDDGDLCIYLDDEEYDGAYYDVSMLLAELEDYNPQTKAYMVGCDKYLTFRFFGENHIFAYDEGNDTVGCDGTVFGDIKR